MRHVITSFLLIFLTAGTAAAGVEDPKPARDFPHKSKHQVRRVITATDECTEACPFDQDLNGGGGIGPTAGCNCNYSCSLNQAKCYFDVYGRCTTDNARAGQPCEACTKNCG